MFKMLTVARQFFFIYYETTGEVKVRQAVCVIYLTHYS